MYLMHHTAESHVGKGVDSLDVFKAAFKAILM